jgi:hypothetical protein
LNVKGNEAVIIDFAYTQQFVVVNLKMRNNHSKKRKET